MSARSRYLAAISPRDSDAIISPTESKHNAAKFDLSSPTAATTRQRLKSFNDKAQNATGSTGAAAPPPPPPPGPPPAKKHNKRNSIKATNSKDISGKEPVSFRKLNQSNAQSQQEHNPPSRSGGGEVWSPKDEIQSGNVARAKQMIWGEERSNNVISPKEGGGKITSPRDRERSVNNEVKNFKVDNGGNKINDESSVNAFQRYQKQLSGQNITTTNAPSTHRAPPSTPPRPSSRRNYNTNNSYGTSPTKGRVSTRSPSPPKYKLNAPPSLELDGGGDKDTPRNGLSINTGGRGGIAPPSRLLNHRPDKSPIKSQYADKSNSTSNTKNPSPLRQRASGLNLAPIDTSFGGNNNDRNSNSLGNTASDASSLPPSGLDPIASPSPTDVADRNNYLSASDGVDKDKYAIPPSAVINKENPIPMVNTSIARTSSDSAPFTPANNPPGVTTVTSFKRHGAKVGIVFTRRSRASPDVCIISKITPDSIFSAHELRYAREEEGGTLKGAEVIAVNGIPVREARHAAELVAGCAAEVRLTIRRTNGASLNVTEVERLEELPIPESMPSSMDADKENRNEKNCLDEESETPFTMDPFVESKKDNVEESMYSAQATESFEMERDRISPLNNTDDRPDDEVEVNKQMTPDTQKVGSISEIERRRLAALKIYQSKDMVADIVDDVRLGIIDAVHPKETFAVSSAFSNDKDRLQPRDPFGDSSSVATTNITTSSVATLRMGSRSIKELFGGDAFSPKNAVSITNPQAQRRKARAMQRISKLNSLPLSKVVTASPSDTPSDVVSPSELRSPVTSVNLTSPKKSVAPMSTEFASEISKSKSDDEVVATSSVTRSTTTFSEMSEETSSRGSRTLFGKKKKQPHGNSVAPLSYQKKKSSIFGVANMIRKVNTRKGKSSKKGQLMEDSSLFQDQELNDISSTPESLKSQNRISGEPETTVVDEINPHSNEPLEQPSPKTKKFAPKEVIPPSSSWGSNDFFENTFASSPFNDPTSSGNDAFGFPPESALPDAGLTMFDDSPDAWGEHSSLNYSHQSDDFTPRKSNTSNFPNNAFDNNMSYNVTELSEVTKSTFISRSGQASLSHEPFESTVPFFDAERVDSFGAAEEKPADGPESQKENIIGGNDTSSMIRVNRGNKLARLHAKTFADVSHDPPAASIEDSSNEEDDFLTMENYGNGGGILRRPVHSDSRINHPSLQSTTLERSTSNSSFSRSLQPEITRGMHSRQNIALPPQTRLVVASSSIGSASARRNERIQRTNKVQQGKQETKASVNSANSTQFSAALTGASSARQHRSAGMGPSPSRGKTNDSFSSSEDNMCIKDRMSPKNVSATDHYNLEGKLMKMKDSIQRSKAHLLCAAAISIQTQSRRFLARQIAIKRMCGILTIQAFVRRWLAERDLEIAIWSIVQIQAVFRGWYARDSLEDNHYCATQIQRVVRGYLATMHVFEDLYSITVVQSVVRMHLAMKKSVNMLSSVIAKKKDYSAIVIQSNWRRYICQMSYQFDIIDIIIVQSLVRRRNAMKKRNFLEINQEDLCAVKIQSAWRSYDCAMTFVHTVADIITVQSVYRRWHTIRYLAVVRLQCLARGFLSKKRFSEQETMHSLLSRHNSAIKIQSLWRSYCAQAQMLIDIVNIIVIQSLWRRKSVLRLYRPLWNRMKLARERSMQKAAVKIQSAWRSFIVFSSYLILRYENQAATTIQSYWRGYYESTNYSILYYEIIKIQAAVRGHQERSWMLFQNNSATIIQAAFRRYLERKDYHNGAMINVLIAAASSSLRTRIAVKKLQRWWLNRIWLRKEKEAALIIERFFICVKHEVEQEVLAIKKKKKEKRRMRKMKESDEWILERAWINTVEDPPSTQEETTAPRPQDNRPPVPINVGNIYTNSDRFIQSNIEEEIQHDISGLTNSSGTHDFSRKFHRTQMDISTDVSLDDTFNRDHARYVSNEKQEHLMRPIPASRPKINSYRGRKAAM